MIKVNLYEGILRLNKAKLYKSPYRKCIDEVWLVLKNFEIKSQLNFLINLVDLEVNVVDSSELDNGVNAQYDAFLNKIFLPRDFNNNIGAEILNHELFHMASRDKKRFKGKSWQFLNLFGQNLNEGITEYLALKSRNIKVSNSGYQLELFVVETLINIFGEQILLPYFADNNKLFCDQFLNYGVSSKVIIQLDEFLQNLSFNFVFNNERVSLLVLSDMVPNIVVENVDFFKELKLDFSCSSAIMHVSLKYEEILKEYLESTGDLEKYEFKDINKKKIFDEYIMEYKNNQEIIFGQILDLLIEIANIRGVSFEDVSNFMRESLSYKQIYLKEVYLNVFNKKTDVQGRKR